MSVFRNYLYKKGQGIVEYALILAFVVGIALALNGTDIGGAVKTTFDKVAAVLGDKKNYAWALKNLSGLSRDDIKNAAEQDERIKMDQEALANIGKLFLGKNEDDLKKILKNAGLIKTDNSKVNENIFLASYHDNLAADGNGYYTDFAYNGTQFKEGYADLLTAMQGGTPNVDTYSDTVGSTDRYFYSNNMLDDKVGDQYANDRSIRVNLHYGTNDQGEVVVDAVRVKVNRGNSKETNESVKNYYRELDVKVGLNKEAKQTISGDPGAINKKESDSVNNSWYKLDNW